MQSRGDFEVFGAVIHQINLPIAGPIKRPQPTPIGTVVSAVVKHRLVFVSINVHSVKTAGVRGVDIGPIYGIVVVGNPVIGAETKGIDLEPEYRVAFFIFDVISITESCLSEVALPQFGADGHPWKPKGRLGLHRDDTIKGTRTIKSTAGSSNNVHFHHIEVWGPQKITQGEVQTRALVVYPINQLQRTHR